MPRKKPPDDYTPVPPPHLDDDELVVWQRVLTLKRVHRAQSETLAAYCRAAVDEQKARAEMHAAIDAGDPASAKVYGTLAKDMRAQMARILDLI